MLRRFLPLVGSKTDHAAKGYPASARNIQDVTRLAGVVPEDGFADVLEQLGADSAQLVEDLEPVTAGDGLKSIDTKACPA